jgi:glucoamylase
MDANPTRAPGAPGGPEVWNPGSKDGVGSAAQVTSNIWFTLGRGSIEEVLFPGPDHPRIRLCALAVADGREFFSWEKTDADSEAAVLEKGVPAYRLVNRCKSKRYRIEKEVIAHPQLSAVIQRTRFFPEARQPLQLYAYLNVHLGKEAKAWLGEYRGTPLLFAQGDGVAVAMASSAPVLKRSVGFCDVSDGLKDLEQHKTLTWNYDLAEGGNVALTAQLDYPHDGRDFLVVIALGFDPDAAGLNAHAALLDGFDKPFNSYCSAWREWQSQLLPLERKSNWGANLYRASTAVMRTHQAKMPPGAIVASITIPFGQARTGIDTGGYHLVWPRDLVETAGALLAAGDGERVRDVITFLEATQMPDGHWPQTMWLNGLPYFNGIQMDETAMVVLLIEHCRSGKVFKPGEDARFWPMIKRAVGYLVCKGPCTPEDRWENSSGYSPFTMGAEIGALLAAADMAKENGEVAIAEYLQETADIWNASIERRTYVIGGQFAEKAGVEGYYIRLGQQNGKAGQRESEEEHADLRKEDLVSTDALALVRFGLRSADDPRMVNTVKAIDALIKVDIGCGPGWRRYLGDHYGEYPNGKPFDKQGGVGRAWPLFIGERAHFEIGAGRFAEAEKLLHLMEKTATNTGLISEQTWDADDIPDKGLYRGRPTTSACPLVWAHAEYVKLLRSLRDRKIFDCPRQTLQRYGKGFTPPARQIWSFHNPIEELAAGETLRVEVLAPARILWTGNHWKAEHEVVMRDTGLGLFSVDLPTKNIAPCCEVEFTFYWTEVDRWESRNFKVIVKDVESQK